jgi:hypothetical protein
MVSWTCLDTRSGPRVLHSMHVTEPGGPAVIAPWAAASTASAHVSGILRQLSGDSYET